MGRSCAAAVGGLMLLLPLLPAVEAIVVDAGADRHPISAGIYGVNCPFGARAGLLADLNVSVVRWGGNSLGRYHWRNDADNKGADWFFESIPAPSRGGSSADEWLAEVRAAGARALITVPTIGWLARLGPGRGKLASFSQATYGPQRASDRWMPDAGDGVRPDGTPVAGNDPADANSPNSPALQAAWVAHLAATCGPAASGTVAWYLLDNEPSLWHQTHRDVHPEPAHDEEVLARMLAYATAIKDADPTALVAGPEEYGWDGYFWSGFDLHWRGGHGLSLDAPDHRAHGDYVPWLLTRMRAAEAAGGRRLLDALSLHYYPAKARGTDGRWYDLEGNGPEADCAQARALRNRSTRALWDPAYVDNSWIAGSPNDASGGVVRLLPRMREWVARHYPGTRIALTEYRWGDAGRPNGATTQADVLGILGREGCDLATRWIVPDPVDEAPVCNAFRMYRNYDGARSTFGELGVRAAAPDPDRVSAFAALRTRDGALTVMLINKEDAESAVELAVRGFRLAGTAEAWQTAGPQAAIARIAAPALADGAPALRLPPQSLTLLILAAAP